MMELSEIVLSKLLDKLIDYGSHTTSSIVDFKSTLESLGRNFRALSARASDVEEDIKNRELSGKKKRKREVENWLKEVQIIGSEFLALEKEVEERAFISRFFGGDRATNLNARVDGLVEQSKHFGDLVLDVDVAKGEPLLAPKLTGEEFEKYLERIWKLLVIDKVRVIGIFGMGGVGKTTLAQHIHNRLGKETQDHVHWITVSQVASIPKMQDEIAKVLRLDLSDENDEDKRAAKLHRALSGKKNFVLILDDVWKNINLEKLGGPLRVDGCRLIITTRSLDVCRQMGCQNNTIEVKTLPMDEAWTLFQETLGQEMILTPQVQEIAKSVANECDGLPLGLITMAGSMRGKTDIHVWRNALEELKESLGIDEMEDKVFRVLKYSFKRLDPNYKGKGNRDGYTNLQLCFLYCSLYPEDRMVKKRELISHLIWEKLLDKRMSRRAEFDQGVSILDKLVNVCLLEVLDGGKSVRMHDLVRDMALKITRDDLKFKVLSGLALKEIPDEEWTEDLNKMSLINNNISEIPPGMSPNCPKLSTLLLSDNPLQFIPDSFFLKMCGLSVLNLTGTKLEKLPKSLSVLENLNALILKNCRQLASVPSLGNLKELRELDLSHTALKEVPQGMENLVKLRYLSLFFTPIKKLPTCLLPRFSYLQHLFLLSRAMKVDGEEIKSLKYLEEFSGVLKDVSDFNSLTTLRQNQVPPLSYEIVLRKTQLRPTVLPKSIKSFTGFERVVGNKLTINFAKSNRFDVRFLAHDIQHLRFMDCEGLGSSLTGILSRFNNLKCLKTLRIEACLSGINCILSLFTNDALMTEEELQSRCLPLRSIEEIYLSHLPNLTGLIDWERYPLSPPLLVLDSIFLSLRKLDISFCDTIKKLWLPLSDLQNLEVITIWSCDNLEKIIYGANEEETEGSGGSVISLPRLKELNLLSLPKLQCIFKATMECNHIESIRIHDCPSLKKLSLFLPLSVDGQTLSPPPALKIISVHKGWWDSLEWENPNHKQILQPFVRFCG